MDLLDTLVRNSYVPYGFYDREMTCDGYLLSRRL
jgi:hypothetical protein